MQATLNPTIQSPPASLLGTPTGELVLQLCGGEHDGRLLRLNAAKCLVGSAAGCTLRLRARGIRPVHALILRGPAGVLVRCWSPDAQLNERAFTEEVLRIGDKLQLGSVTLSVVELAESVPAPLSAFRTPPTEFAQPAANSFRTQPRSRERRRRLFEHLRRERQEQTSLQVTVATQQAQLAALEAQVEQLQAEVIAQANLPAPSSTDDALNQQFAKTIQQLQEELEAAAKRRTFEQQTAARQRAAVDEQAAERLQQELAVARQKWQAQSEQQLTAATAELTNRHRLQLAALEQEQAANRRNLESLQAALAAKGKSEEQVRTSLAAQLEQLNQAFILVRQERDELFEQLHADQQSLDRQYSKWQTQVEDARRSAQAQIHEAQAAAQKQLFQLRDEFAVRERQWDEELLARTKAEAERRAEDAERMTKLAAEYDTLRNEATAAAAANRQQQEGFTQARKRLEAEIATLSTRLQQTEQALHDVRENSGQVQAAVLADAEQARAQRDAVREQMLRQQQDWTEFRSRLESAAAAERELAQARYAALEAELVTRNETAAQVQAECVSLEERIEKLQVELEQSQEYLGAAAAERELAQARYAALEAELASRSEAAAQAKAECVSLEEKVAKLQVELEQSMEALFAAESGANQRLQQMTISMEQLQLDRGDADAEQEQQKAEREQERAEWDQERNSLVQCVADLQQEVSQLTANLLALEQQVHQATLEAAARAETAQQQLQLAQEQLTHWQTAAEQAKQQSAELLAAVTRFQEQEQVWQHERELLDQVQLVATNRLQHLESSITELQQQLEEAQRAVAVTCPPSMLMQSAQVPPAHEENIGCTINVNNQELAALREQQNDSQRIESQRAGENISGTINVNDQDLAAFHEQMRESQPSLLAPRVVLDADTLAALQGREAALQEQADELAAQQAQLEEEQAIVARQRIELEQFQASLAQLERSLAVRAEAWKKSTMAEAEPQPEPAPDQYSDSYYGEAEHEVSPLSESEAFAAMADHVANLYRVPDETSDQVQAAAVAEPERPYIVETPRPEIDERTVEESGEESLVISTPVSNEVANDVPDPVAIEFDPVLEPTIIGPAGDEDFDNQIEARITRMMRRENNTWSDSAPGEHEVESSFVAVEATTNEAAAASEVPTPDQSQAVNSVLDRLREAGLWKGEGTAKADQLPSSGPPIDEGSPALCRLSEDGPVGHEVSSDEFDEPATASSEPESAESDDLSLLAKSRPTSAGLLSPPASEQSEADDSIESYMSRLMARLKTSDVEEPRKTGSRGELRSLRTTPPPAPPPPPKSTDSRPLTSLNELAPRCPAPELSSNLAAMRELANSAARGAIESHQQRSGKQKVNMRTINTLMALLVCSGLLYCWTRTGSLIAVGGAGLSLTWAAGSCLVAASQSLKLRKTAQTNEETPSAE